MSAEAPLLFGLVTLIWWAAVAAAEIAARAGGPLLVLAPAVVVLVLGTAASAHVASPDAVPAGIAVLLLGLLLFTGPRRPLRAAGIAVLVTAVAGVTVPVLPGLASRPAADPRSLIRQPVDTLGGADPLSQVAAWLAQPARPLFTVRTDDPVNTRWLVLDRYDGIQWTSSARYQPAGSRLDTSGTGATVTATIRITGLPGPWLPAAATPRQVTGVSIAADPLLGVLATDDGRSAQGSGYTVTSTATRPTIDQLATAVPGAGTDFADDLTVPAGLPSAVATFGRAAMAGAAYPYQQLVLLADRLRSTLSYDPAAFPAQSYGNLASVVTTAHRGGQDVFATLFAVLARAAGFPARIAVGFGAGQATGPRTYQVTTADALVWPEVYLSGLGWTAFYPVPQARPATGQGVTRAAGEPPWQASLDQRVAAQNGGPRSGGPARVSVAAGGGDDWLPALGIGIAALAAVSLAGRLVFPVATRISRRRRRRRDRDPRRRTVGAWRDLIDSLARRTGAALDCGTPAEIARQAQAAGGVAARDRAARLGALAEIALYAPDLPGYRLTAQDAAAAWADADAVRKLVSRSPRTRVG